MGVSALIIALLTLAGQAGDDALLEQARGLRRAERPEEAIALLEGAADRRGADAELEGLLGTLLLEVGRLGDAQRLAESLAGREGESYRAHVFLGQLAERHDDPEAALQSFRRAAGLKPRPIEALAGQVVALLALGREGQAVKRGEELAGLYPDTGRPLLARALVQQGNAIMLQGIELYGLATERFRRALAAQPDDHAILERLLEVLVLTLRIEEAQELVQGLLTAPGDATDRHYWLGRCHEAGREFEDARAEYLLALGEALEHGPSALQLARLALAEGHGDEARRWLGIARARLGESTRTLALQADVHQGLGELAEAEGLLRRLIAASPEDAGAHYQLARVLFRQGRREEGGVFMERFRELQLATRPVVHDR